MQCLYANWLQLNQLTLHQSLGFDHKVLVLTKKLFFTTLVCCWKTCIQSVKYQSENLWLNRMRQVSTKTAMKALVCGQTYELQMTYRYQAVIVYPFHALNNTWQQRKEQQLNWTVKFNIKSNQYRHAEVLSSCVVSSGFPVPCKRRRRSAV